MLKSKKKLLCEHNKNGMCLRTIGVFRGPWNCTKTCPHVLVESLTKETVCVSEVVVET